ncbi:MAG TPA: sigma-54-dependent Fis family transcriptional regulator [Planctomycetota bacterium]|nr:sigma-54-dependent Fis family transcriptional regulator [Planctomycetota bacterium]
MPDDAARSRKRAQAATKLLDFLERAARRVPGRELFGDLLDALVAELDCERVFLFRLRKTGGFRVIAARSRDREDLTRPGERISHHAVKKMVAQGSPFFVPDARHDRRYRSEEVLRHNRPAHSILVLPLCRGGEVEGGVYADHRFQFLHAPAADDTAVRGLIALLALALDLKEGSRDARKRLAAEEEGDEEGAPGRPLPADPAPARAAEARLLAEDEASAEDFHGLLSANPDFRDVFDTVRGLAVNDLPVLLLGETGTGKGLLARALHECSERRSGPFVAFHSGAVPESLAESELLGHVKGAFTGAERDHEGVFAQANGGTLLLDEVGDMTIEVQKKLLRVLEDGWVRPVGAKEPARVDVRLVASTTRDLESLVKEGTFRGDLYYRLKGAVIEVPALRDRREDVLPLARRFLGREAQRQGRKTPHLGDAAALRLVRHPWPGNVRELENEMRRLVALGVESVGASDLTIAARSRRREGGAPEGKGTAGRSLEEAVEAAERQAIVAALEMSRGNKSRAAIRLGITRKSLYRRMAKYRIGT